MKASGEYRQIAVPLSSRTHFHLFQKRCGISSREDTEHGLVKTRGTELCVHEAQSYEDTGHGFRRTLVDVSAGHWRTCTVDTEERLGTI